MASLSDSRTAREAVGHTGGAVTRVYLSKGRKSDVDWASMRLVQDTDKENAMVPKRRRNDVLLPPSPERKALTQIRAPNLNARETDKRTNDLETNETGIDSYSDDPLNNCRRLVMDRWLDGLPGGLCRHEYPTEAFCLRQTQPAVWRARTRTALDGGQIVKEL